MVRIAPIKLQYSPKTLWFDPKDLELSKDDAVVVTTARGTEFGHMADDVFEASDADIKKLKSELKPVLRLASLQDEEKAQEMQKRSDEALPLFKEIAAEASEDMHPVSVEFLLDGDKAIFYFEAEDRVDFRELVRKLASKFHARIDMRQIGVRDEARIIGGLGHCGQELCCKRLGGEFCPVSIRMAKEQDLSLNPQKISGVCGRLMCCLRYEFDAYKDFKGRAPKINATIDTPEGPAKVVDLNVPREIVTIQLPDERRIKIPLAEMTAPEEGLRPNKVTPEVLDTYANQDMFATLDPLALSPFGDSSLFSTPDTLAKTERKGSNKQEGSQTKETTRKPRRRTKMGKDGETQTERPDKDQASQGRSKKRSNQRNGNQAVSRASSEGGQAGRNKRKRSTQRQGAGQSGQNGQAQSSQKQSQERASTGSQGQAKQRPGQRSSGLRRGQEHEGRGDASRSSSQQYSSPRSSGGGGSDSRKPRRSHKAGSSDSSTTGAAE